MIRGEMFICPRCSASIAIERGIWFCSQPICPYARKPFPVIDGRPALVDFEHSVIEMNRLNATEGASDIRRSRLHRLRTRLTQRDNPVAAGALQEMLRRIQSHNSSQSKPRVLIVGGGSIGSGSRGLYDSSAIELIAFDIYTSPTVQFIGDAHSIPLADESVDGVIVQAVLEHVLNPTRVADEIHRVLRDGGIVYADTPFMQQVHEGPYDFTRFTDSGHRFLFRRFDRIDSGTVAGAGTALLWSIRYFVRALTRSVKLGEIVGVCFFWLSFADRLLDRGHSADAASSVFFLGQKSGKAITEKQIISYYRGGL